MSIEIEAKYQVDDLPAVADKLVQLHAERIGTLEQTDMFYDRPDHSLINADSGLRIRHETRQDTSICQLCFKGPKRQAAFKSREEIEFNVDSPDKAGRLLEALGFIPLRSVIKTRQMWRYNHCDICLDTVKDLGTFVEIEGPDEQTIHTAADHLGLAHLPHIPVGYSRLLAEKDNV